MTLDATKPEDSVLVSEIPGYIRENRAAINSAAVAGTGNVGASAVDILGAVTLTIGSELSLEGLETVIISNSGAPCAMTAFLGGIQGQIKILIFQDLNIDLTDSDTKLNGTFHLNEAPAGGDYSPDVDDVLTLVNVGGDGAGTHGYWREVDRAANV
jgi:hypothetical protein